MRCFTVLLVVLGDSEDNKIEYVSEYSFLNTTPRKISSIVPWVLFFSCQSWNYIIFYWFQEIGAWWEPGTGSHKESDLTEQEKLIRCNFLKVRYNVRSDHISLKLLY